MKIISETNDRISIEISKIDQELIDCMFSMINSEDNPNWGASDNGHGSPQLNEEKFDELCVRWRSVMNKPLSM